MILNSQKTLIISFFNKLKRIFRYFKWCFTPFALIFIIFFAWKNSDTLINVISSAKFAYLLISIILWSALHFITPACLRLIVNSLNKKLSYRDAFLSHTLYLPARYIPGGIWHNVARYFVLSKRGFEPSILTTYLFIENLVSVCITIILGAICILLLNVPQQYTHVVSTSLGISILFLPICFLIINQIILRTSAKLQLYVYLRHILISNLYWILSGLSFIFYINAFGEVIIQNSWLEIGGAYLFSWGVGFLAFFAPQGLGVSEVILASFIHTNLNTTALIAFLAGFRAIALLSDILTWIIAVVYKTRNHSIDPTFYPSE